MTKPANDDPTDNSVADALRSFAAVLTLQGLLDKACRLETTVRGRCSLEPLRRAEAAFDATWPVAGRPSHEFVWSTAAGDPQTSIRVRAFDCHGKLLHSHQFPMGASADVAA